MKFGQMVLKQPWGLGTSILHICTDFCNFCACRYIYIYGWYHGDIEQTNNRANIRQSASERQIFSICYFVLIWKPFSEVFDSWPLPLLLPVTNLRVLIAVHHHNLITQHTLHTDDWQCETVLYKFKATHKGGDHMPLNTGCTEYNPSHITKQVKECKKWRSIERLYPCNM